MHASKSLELHKQWENNREKRRVLDFHPSFAPLIQKTVGLAAEEIIRFISGFGPVRTYNGRFSVDPISGQIFKYEIQEGQYVKI